MQKSKLSSSEVIVIVIAIVIVVVVVLKILKIIIIEGSLKHVLNSFFVWQYKIFYCVS